MGPISPFPLLLHTASKMMKTFAFLVYMVGVVTAQQPPTQIIVGADGHGQLTPPLEQAILGADGHGTYNPEVTPTAPTWVIIDVEAPSTTSNSKNNEEATAATPALLGVDGHGTFNAAAALDEPAVTATAPAPEAGEGVVVDGVDALKEAAQEEETSVTTTGTQESPNVVTETQQGPILGADGHGQQQLEETAAPVAAVEEDADAAAADDDGDDDDDDSYWTFTHFNNDTVCWAGTDDADDDADDRSATGEQKSVQWCASSRTWYMLAFLSHVFFWGVAITIMLMAFTIHKRGKHNRALRNRMAVMEISGHEYGDFVASSAAGDDRIELVPPSYKEDFPQKPTAAHRWFASVA